MKPTTGNELHWIQFGIDAGIINKNDDPEDIEIKITPYPSHGNSYISVVFLLDEEYRGSLLFKYDEDTK